MNHHNHPESSIENPTLAHFRHFSSLYFTLAHFRHFSSLFTNLPSTSVENPLQITYFLCKTNPISERSKWTYTYMLQRITKIYLIGHLVKTNPIQTQFKPNQTQSPKSQNECKLVYNKGLQKKR